MRFLTGGKEQHATSPRAIRQNRFDPDTDGYSPDERNTDGEFSYNVRLSLERNFFQGFLLPDRFQLFFMQCGSYPQIGSPKTANGD